MKRDMSRVPCDWLEEIIHLSLDKVIVVDRHGIILYLSPEYCEFIGTTPEKAHGQPVEEIIKNTRMHVVVKTGEKEIEHLQPINDSVMIANRYPIIINNDIVGGLGTVVFPDPDKLRIFNKKINNLMEELHFYRSKAEKETDSKYTFADLIGTSPPFLTAKKLAERVAGNDSSVLITGESGTGKELFAHAIHHDSLRSQFPFMAINCASIPEELFESELFGYEEGAFTGGKKSGKDGLFKVANNGTVFLDEIGDMPLMMQSKLLRALQEKEIQPIGASKPVPIDLRIIAATNHNLTEMVREGSFREDLYYRLNVIHIQVPPLRDRPEDIEPIARMLLNKLEKKFYKYQITLTEEVVENLKQHKWPGNVRELENVLERAINVLDGKEIQLVHLPLYIRDIDAKNEYAKESAQNRASSVVPDSYSENGTADRQIESPPIQPLKDTVMEAEKKAIERVLMLTEGDKLEAAGILGISKTSMYDKCKQYGIR